MADTPLKYEGKGNWKADDGSILAEDVTITAAGGTLILNSGEFLLTMNENGFVVTNSQGAEIIITGDGLIKVIGLPIADPHVVNTLWNSAGAVKISAG